VAKSKNDQPGSTLGDFAAGVGTLFGKAERKWREWGPSEAIERAVADVRDRAAALLAEVNTARTATSHEAAASEPTVPPPPAPPKPRATRRVARKATKQAGKTVKKAAKASRPAPKARAKAKR
jgi:hypothetical protein